MAFQNLCFSVLITCKPPPWLIVSPTLQQIKWSTVEELPTSSHYDDATSHIQRNQYFLVVPFVRFRSLPQSSHAALISARKLRRWIQSKKKDRRRNCNHKMQVDVQKTD